MNSIVRKETFFCSSVLTLECRALDNFSFSFVSDIAGFTAWSSIREPSQVFTLLEAVYNAFDKIAKRLNVFKVETIGDCYVAAGMPSPCLKS